MTGKSHSWSLCSTLSKNADSRGSLASSSEGGQRVARASRVLIRASRPNQSYQFSPFTSNKIPRSAGCFPLFSFCFSQVFRVLSLVRGFYLLPPILILFSSQP